MTLLVAHAAGLSAGTTAVYVGVVKPVADRVVAGVLLVVGSPLLAAVAAAVLRDLGPPVVFRQTRVGQHGNVITVYKFRTMRADRRHLRAPVAVERRCCHKSPSDPRVTRLGATLRRWSLDELPQLWNVLNGTMSLVGPRPELPEIVAGYSAEERERLEVKPGLTGLWQVVARGRTDQPMHHLVALDTEYARTVSLRTDLAILRRTAGAIVRNPGY